MLVLGRLMTKQDDGANGCGEVDDKIAVAVVAVVEEDDDDDDDSDEVTEEDMAPPALEAAGSLPDDKFCNLVSASCGLVALKTVSCLVLPSKRRRCNPDVFLICMNDRMTDDFLLKS